MKESLARWRTRPQRLFRPHPQTIMSSSSTDTTIEVIGRIRPSSSGLSPIVSIDSDSATLVVSNQRFTFTAAAGPEATQESIFEVAGRRASDAALAGYNATVFAYGQTGSGKTHTIYGPTGSDVRGGVASDQRGLLPRTLEYVFAQMRAAETASNGKIKFSAKASFLEVRTFLSASCKVL